MDSKAVLGANGPFAQQVNDFTVRPIQQQLAERVEATIQDGGVLVAESGTGTGKTFAYLVPALLSGKRIVVSTGTRHLQDQLFYRDLPAVRTVLGVAPDIALLKGRANYLCLWRLSQLGNQTAGRYDTSILKKRAIIEAWSAQTRVGETAEVGELEESDPVWREVTSTADNCLGGDCPDFSACFVNKARQRAMKANVVVVNHHLFFSDVSLKEQGFGELLPAYDAVIFDEAHQVPEIASRFFGFSVSTWQLSELCRDILVSEAKEKSGVPLNDITAALKQSLAELDLAFAKSDQSRGESALVLGHAPTMYALNQVLEALAELETALSQAAVAGEGLERCHQRCLLQQGYLLDWMDGGRRTDQLVCWYEVGRNNTRLTATPMNVANKMRTVLEQPNKAWVFTSATLAAGHDFGVFTQHLGCVEPETLLLDSPFDYAHNALLYLPKTLPEPGFRQFPQALVEAIIPVLEASQGRAFVLFTSYQMLHQLRDRLRNSIQWPLLVQGEAPRSELIDEFKRLGNAVLLGTASFWEGVDIKGATLSCVIIDKLPFTPPNDPVMRARAKQLEATGGNPFMELQVPEAIISLKQGAGRLIRDENDQGVLMLCDARLHTKRYGSRFVDALPPMAQTNDLSDVQAFFQ